jgi:hypothetical protein
MKGGNGGIDRSCALQGQPGERRAKVSRVRGPAACGRPGPRSQKRQSGNASISRHASDLSQENNNSSRQADVAADIHVEGKKRRTRVAHQALGFGACCRQGRPARAAPSVLARNLACLRASARAPLSLSHGPGSGPNACPSCLV